MSRTRRITLGLLLQVCGWGAGSRHVRKDVVAWQSFPSELGKSGLLPLAQFWMDALLPSAQRGVPVPAGFPPHGQLSTVLALHGVPGGCPPTRLSHPGVPSLRGGPVSRPDLVWGQSATPAACGGPEEFWAGLWWHLGLAALPGGGLWAQGCIAVGAGQASVTVLHVCHRREAVWGDWDVDRISVLTMQRRKPRQRAAADWSAGSTAGTNVQEAILGVREQQVLSPWHGPFWESGKAGRGHRDSVSFLPLGGAFYTRSSQSLEP